MNEKDFSKLIRIQATKKNIHLWRNNVGGFYNLKNQFIRYGLMNDSAQLNAIIKSSDLIGLKQTTITQDMVGKTVGIFVAYETKKPGWIYKATKHEIAQKNWIDLINRLGGEAKFITDIGDL